MLKRAATEIGIWAVVLATIAFVLSGCTQQRVAIVKPPVELTTCEPEPVAPILPDRTEQAARDMVIGTYILALVMAGADCRARVEAVKAWSEAL